MPNLVAHSICKHVQPVLVCALGRCCCRATFYLLVAFVIIIMLAGTRIQLATGGCGWSPGEAQVARQEEVTTTDHGDVPPSQPNKGSPQDKAAVNSTLLYECKISYVQMDKSLIKFSINYLKLTPPGADDDDDQGNLELGPGPFELPAINYESQPSQLRALTKLNASQPFVFFINGFNTFGPTDEINVTWMYDVAKSFASRPGSVSIEGAEWNLHDSTGYGPRNVIFLTWSIPNLFASNLLSMIPAYYKTVANYDLIVDCVARTLAKLLMFVDLTRRFETPAMRLDYFRSWHFYGHSLGSHILSDAISRVVAQSSQITSSAVVAGGNTTGGQPASLQLHRSLKFGKLVGLDPATPCFVSREYGISSAKVALAIQELLVLHSNAGFAGVPNERANLELVLNGGTFQPGCSWYDFTCHHVRSTDILSYLDDQCQMVAYKCTSYHHFKLGACETCYGPPSLLAAAAAASKLTPASYELWARNCVLVNLPEQHRDSRVILEYAEQFEDKLRQLAEVPATGGGGAPSSRDIMKGRRYASTPQPTIELFRRLDELERRERERERVREQATAANTTAARPGSGQLPQGTGSESVATNKARKAHYHFVSTSPNFRFGRKTHCLQHYQLRLLIYHNGSGNLINKTSLQEKCKLSSYYVSASDEIKLKIYYESAPSPYESEPGDLRIMRAPKLVLNSGDPRQMSSSIKLSAVIKDLFHTTLVNFEGAPRLFTGAQLTNIDWAGLSECWLREGATGNGPNFVLDVAFMSHTNYKIRHAFSSILCGQLEPAGTTHAKRDNASEEERTKAEEQLTLQLCKRSDLANVSSQIDKLLDHMRLHRLDETWKVSLLNSLFSLFTEWEPF